MAGLFRYNSNMSTPTRKYTTMNPFCTSPGQFQDVTMDESYALGYRSPSTGFQHAGSTPPGQGRSVREVEEQMASLRKENFNLKLRIYFLEEKIPGYKSLNADENESLLKQYVDLKVDVEVLRTELQEKQALLCEAAKAMELMEEQQKTSEEKHKEIIDELNEKIHFMEMENKDLEQPVEQNQMNEITASFGFLGDIDAFQRVRELEASLQQFKDQSEELGVQVEDLRKSVEQKNEKIKELEEKEKQLLNENAELQKEFDNKTKELVNVERNLKHFQEKFTQDKENKENSMKKEKEGFQNDIDKLRCDLEPERKTLIVLVTKVHTQHNFFNEVQSVILEKGRDTSKKRKIRNHNNEVETFRREQSNLRKAEVDELNNEITSDLNKRTNYACNSYPDPRMFKNEFKSLHNSPSSYHSQDNQKTHECSWNVGVFPALPAPVLCPVHSPSNTNNVKFHSKKLARENLISTIHQSLKLEASRTSLDLEASRSYTSSPADLFGYSRGNAKDFIKKKLFSSHGINYIQIE